MPPFEGSDISALGLSNTEAEGFEAMLADREQEEVTLEMEAADDSLIVAGASADGAVAAARVSDASFKLIVDYETGGKAFYELVIKSRPIWPKEASGVTIGFGYDLGYVTRDEFRSDWAALPSGDRNLLETCVGFHSGKDPATKMQMLLASVKHIIVAWAPSEAVFKAKTLPKFALMTQNALPNTGLLSGDCFGTLVSLTFNRGASYSKAHNPTTDPKDRYREMRAIKAAMISRKFGDIPGLLKAMIRIWVGTAVETGLRRRRNDEAALFLTGLAAPVVASGPLDFGGDAAAADAGATAAAAPLPERAESVPASQPNDENFWTEVSEDDLAAEAENGLSGGILAGGATWAPDNVQPDYAHLGGNLLQNASFALKAEDLQLLAQLNDFDLSGAGDTVLFGLRGCGVVKDHTVSGGPILMDQRPDHNTPRCIIGVWKRATGTVSVFPASTVPNQAAVALYKRNRSAGNILATGLHSYVCGPHITSRTTPGCFLLRKPDMSKRVVVVRRSTDDLSYQKTDIVDRCAPGDNIHPTFFSTMAGFSSLGCQVVVGTFKEGRHSGPWSELRKAVGFTDNDGEPGKQFRYMLLTGAEARLASKMRIDGLAADPLSQRRLRRLRQGSSGQRVDQLQSKLQLAEPDGQMGPFSTESLHKFQTARQGARGSDGIFSPEMDEALGWGVFSTVGV
ncbi:hypothetical protein [Mesorhizobium sp. L48C026A00]|uniref:hypothetical protein n=1 Tax=Mesorhizobium sp. L48C026A00 TaxID=1287182 RepID=UPI0003CFE257|nr:hypothetical protein [Mesorhizobium sp. L48C026A00]ESZ10164.1 hypothetical protein X737_32190 [Mesorhizobium sp. L48C026A00]